MSIKYQILGKPGRDNAMIVWVDSGTHQYKLLFDCGENLLHEVRQSDIKSIDYLFFSHLHIDHIAGFDYFFRRNYDRETKPVYIYGPEETTSIIHHRLQGYKWNLVNNLPGDWIVTDITENTLVTKSFRTSEGFSVEHNQGRLPFMGQLLETPDFTVRCAVLNHMIPTIAYAVIEKNTFNIDKSMLLELDLKGGPWLETVKDLSVKSSENIIVDDKSFRIKDLREKLLVETKGQSIAYLTDFVSDELSRDRAVDLVKDCGIVVCESQYSQNDSELALRNYHMTTKQTAEIARRAKAEKLILFHISERYSPGDDYAELLNEARELFPETYYPEQWNKYLA